MSFAFIEPNDDLSGSSHTLVSGYIRQKYAECLPTDILKLCHNYCKHSLTWKISHDDFMAFQNKAKKKMYEWHDECLLGPIFRIHGIEFECRMISAFHAQFMQFQIRVRSMENYTYIHNDRVIRPDNVRSLVIYYEVCCRETNSSEKDTKVLEKNGDSMLWPMYNMTVKECRNCRYLTFHVYLDIIKVYFDRSNTSIHFRPITMHKQASFVWTISGILLEEFKQSHFGKYWYSANFGLDGSEINDDNFAWCLYAAPHGYNQTMNQDVYVGLVLLNLPPQIKAIEINYVIKVWVSNTRYIHYQKKRHTMHYKSNCAAINGSHQLKITDIRNMKYGERMTVNAHIDIVRIFDDKACEVEKSKWNRFGIITESMWSKFDLSKSFTWLTYPHQR
eukprot:33413_1